jgi:hypothetical protein
MTTEDRVRALRRDRGRPAQLSKIVTAGVAASAVLGLTAAFGWSAGDDTPPPPVPLADLGALDVASVPAVTIQSPAPPPAGVIPVAIPAAVPAPRSAPDATTSGSH